MGHHVEKIGKNQEDIVIDGWESGSAPSPHRGLGNMQGVNIATETGEVMVSYNRVQQSQNSSASGAVGYASNNTLSFSPLPLPGQWITIANSSNPGVLPNGQYYVYQSGGNSVELSTSYANAVQNIIVSGFTSPLTASWSLYRIMGKAVQSAVESYYESASTIAYRYYILDVNGLVWVNDTGVVLILNQTWFLPDPTIQAPNGNAAGIAVFNGWIHIFIEDFIYVKETVLLGTRSNSVGTGWDILSILQTGNGLNTPPLSLNSHFAIVNQSNILTYCDGAFIGQIQSSSNSASTASTPIWSYAQWLPVLSGTQAQIVVQIGGSLPQVGSTITFTNSPGGSLPVGINYNQVYYVTSVTQAPNTNATLTVSTTLGGSNSSLAGGTGIQYFNTYDPQETLTGNPKTYIFVPEAVTLPFTAVSQSLCEIGNTLVIGTQSNIIYFFDETSTVPLATSFIPIAETNVSYLVNVNNFAYIFAGTKGNIYVTNGSAVSAVISVPDYCAGIPGSPSSYIEPYFTWGGAAFIRGRVYFSIQDQTAIKTGNCGGVWSFIPTQNIYVQQDTGISLRMEAQNSYGTFNGVATVILPAVNQSALGTQYWAAWTSSLSSPTYGIDFTDVIPFLGGSIVESESIPIGTLLNKKTFQQLEYKLSTPLALGESVLLKYRTTLTDTWHLPLGDVVQEPNNDLSGYYTVDFQNVQWLQIQATLNSTATNPSFVRLTEIRIR